MSYDVTLSNGTLYATLYPLEKNGPDNRSTPRHILEADSTGNTFKIAGDMTGRFVIGFVFDVQNSGGNDGTYTVIAPGATVSGSPPETTIPVTSVPSESLPLGEVEYANLDSRTSISLLGQGAMNWGENIANSLVHLLENFASDTAPELNANIGTTPAAEPLTGQWWYKTDSDEFYYFDGTAWVNAYNFSSLILPDLEDGNKKFHITASETNLPAPWVGSPNNEPGLVIWEESDPGDGEAVFRVLSSGADQLLRVEYHSTLDSAYLSTTNTLRVEGQGTSEIYGQLAIGNDGAPTFDRTLTVEGDGIAVNSDTGSDATVDISAPSSQISNILFNTNSVLRAELQVDDNVAGQPLLINVGGSTAIEIRNDQTSEFFNLISVDPALNYETLVAADDDIPNKRFIDDNFQPLDDDLTTIAGLTPAAGEHLIAVGSPPTWSSQPLPVSFIIVCTDETAEFATSGSPPTLDNPVMTFRMPHAMTLTEVRASVTTAPTGTDVVIDIKREGSPASIFSTLLSIDAEEKTSTTATTPAVISQSSLLDDEEITVEITQTGGGSPAGSPTGSPTSSGTGLKVTFIGTRA